jgi:HEAT repeat protein
MAGLADPLGAELLTRLATAGPSSTVRAAAFKAMGKSKSPSLTAVLVEKGLTDETDYARRMAVKSLAERRNYDDATVQRVAALGADDKGWSKDQVLDYFVVWNDLKALPYLRSFLKDPNPNNRVAACKALGLYMSEDPVPDLLELLADPKESVRVAAKDVLERIRFYNEEKRRWQDWKRAGGDTPAEGLRKLLTALDDKDAEVRIAAIESLGTMKAREALPTLVERLKSTPAGAEREALTKAIAKINQ